jgi:hypothetical protein
LITFFRIEKKDKVEIKGIKAGKKKREDKNRIRIIYNNGI